MRKGHFKTVTAVLLLKYITKPGHGNELISLLMYTKNAARSS